MNANIGFNFLVFELGRILSPEKRMSLVEVGQHVWAFVWRERVGSVIPPLNRAAEKCERL
jgi:hypothetical protein